MHFLAATAWWRFFLHFLCGVVTVGVAVGVAEAGATTPVPVSVRVPVDGLGFVSGKISVFVSAPPAVGRKLASNWQLLAVPKNGPGEGGLVSGEGQLSLWMTKSPEVVRRARTAAQRGRVGLVIRR